MMIDRSKKTLKFKKRQSDTENKTKKSVKPRKGYPQTTCHTLQLKVYMKEVLYTCLIVDGGRRKVLSHRQQQLFTAY